MTVRLPRELQRRIDDLASGFEARIAKGEPIKLEWALVRLDTSALGELAELAERNLFEQLLATEIFHLHRRREHPALTEYEQRYPKHTGAIRRAFGEFNRQPHDSLTPGDSLGNYLLLRRVGQGGMGEVWHAWNKNGNKPVAIKVIKDAQGARPDLVNLFKSEIRMMGPLQHDNVLELYDAGEASGRLFLVMRYIDGMSLQELIDRRKSDIAAQADTILYQQVSVSEVGTEATIENKRTQTRPVVEPQDAARYILEAAHGTQYLHKYGIVHRDIKPGNIMLEEVAAERGFRARVADFGLARTLVPTTEVKTVGAQPSSLQRAGTPSYMAPEQVFEARHATPLSDIYSLGATLYALLIGGPPIRLAPQDEGSMQLVTAAQEEALVPPRALVGGLSANLEAICLKCLGRDPAIRYQTAGDLAADLERFLSGEPVRARTVSRPQRIWLWCRRKPASAGLIATSVLVLATILAWGSRELLANRRAMAQQSEILTANAAKFAQRGDWRAALENLDRARILGTLGHADLVQIDVARTRGLIAINSVAYMRELEALCGRSDLGNHTAQVYLMQGLGLLLRGEEDAGIEMLQTANSLGTLTPAEAAVADAVLAETSPEVIRKLELAVKLDPLSYDAQSWLISAFLMSGRHDDAIRQAEIAVAFFPESPTYPLFLAHAAAFMGNQSKVDQYLQMPACAQLSPDAREVFVEFLSSEVIFTEFISAALDIDFTEEEFERMLMMGEKIMPLAIRMRKYFSAGPGQIMEYPNESPQIDDREQPVFDLPRFGPLEGAGIPCISQAYRPIRDVFSFRTWGFLLTGNGSTKRIDQLIKECDESGRIHPDGLFQFIRGRLLYARGHLAEAAAAFAKSASLPCIIPALRRDASTHAARCHFELYQRGQVDARPVALRFVQQRLKMGPVSPRHAKILSEIALLAGDIDAARRLLQQLENVEDDSWIAVKRAEIELVDNKYLEAVNLLHQIPVESEAFEEASRIKAEALKRARHRVKDVAEAVERT